MPHLLHLLVLLAAPALSQPQVTVSFPAARSAAPLDGRLLLLFSVDPSDEPRHQIDFGPKTQVVFGVDVEGWAPGTPRTIPLDARGFPLQALKDLPAGTYRVQALLNRYETYHLADGRTLKLPPDHWEGQRWNLKPGNLLSTPREVRWPARLELSLDQELPPVDDFAAQETKYVKYVRMRSEKLSRFWGRDVELGAWVLLPEGYDAHPQARYPLVISHGHFPSRVEGWRETPPDPDLKPDHSERFNLDGYNRIQQQAAHDLYRAWTGPGFPRVLLVQLQHPTPYYDDSYAVNSANNGPYGDAIQEELLPELERRFRSLGAGWARFLYGGSTGGWESMAVQLLYPEAYNGAWIACPDPIDFHHYTVVDIYRDTNAYFAESRWKKTPRPGHRDALGHVGATLQELNQYELALGTHGRSGDQWDVWESVYSPVGPDGYPARLWDKETGAIDPKVAAAWEAFDLHHLLRTRWAELGPKLKGKLRIYVGDMDNYYLNNAVYPVDRFLASATPRADAVVDYGDRAEHCWNGDHARPNAFSRLRYPQLVLPWVVERALATAPPGADVTSWRY
jgi:hypothetical protein